MQYNKDQRTVAKGNRLFKGAFSRCQPQAFSRWRAADAGEAQWANGDTKSNEK
jgi:hypothetical protein